MDPEAGPKNAREASDSELVKRCLAGRAEAWELLIHRYRRLIYSIPVSYGFDSEQADEIFQSVSLKLLEKLPKIRKTESLASWISTTTRRECWHQSKQRRQNVPLEDEHGETLIDEDPKILARIVALERQHAVALAMQKLDSRCRQLLSALYYEDPTPSYEEISRRLDRPVGSLGPTRRRCIEKLKKIFESLQ